MEERHRKLLKANRINLARDLDIDGATSHLYANDILSENDRDSIQGITGQKPKSEKLLDILPRRGPEAFDRFVQFLDKEQPFLAVLLKPSSSEGSKQPADNLDSSARLSPDMKPVVKQGEESKPMVETSPDPVRTREGSSSSSQTGTMESKADGIGPSGHQENGADQGDGGKGSRLSLKPSTVKDGFSRDHIYPMLHRPRGQAFIINNKKFLPASGMQRYPRNGTDVDADDLYKLFTALHFETVVYHNKTSKEINIIFEDYAYMDHTNYDCIICAILTHGEEGLIYSTDGKIPIKNLTSKFRSKNLLGIPKLFFFQACQGFEYMEGVEQTDGAGAAVDEVDAPGNNRITLPIEADFMYAYSTVPGYYSWRNSVRGSWFVQAIVSVFREHALTMDVLRMMTRVNADVAKQKSNTNEFVSDNKKQIPSIISQLRKELYFFPENVLAEPKDTTDSLSPKQGKKCTIA